MQGGEGGEDQVHQDVGIGIEGARRQYETIDADPERQDQAEEDDESPTAAERRYRIREPLAEG